MTQEQFLSLLVAKKSRSEAEDEIDFMLQHRAIGDDADAIDGADTVVSVVFNNKVYITYGNASLNRGGCFYNNDYMSYHWYEYKSVKKYPQRAV